MKKLRNHHILRFIVTPEGGDGGGSGGASNDAADQAAAAADVTKAADKANEPLGEGGIKALQAERERASKAEKELADLKQAQADATKSAEELAAERLTAAEAKAAAAELTAMKYTAAAAKGISLDLAPRLVGSTLAELEADAETFKASLGATPSGKPKPDLSQGSGSTTSATGVSAGRDIYAERHSSKSK